MEAKQTLDPHERPKAVTLLEESIQVYLCDLGIGTGFSALSVKQQWTFVTSQSFCGSGAAGWTVQIWSFHEIVAEMSARAAVVRRLPGWATNTHGRWDGLAAGGLSSSPRRLIHRAAWVSSQHGCRTPPDWSKRQQGRSHSVSTSGVTYQHFCNILLVTQVFPTQCGGGTKQGVNARRWGPSGAS